MQNFYASLSAFHVLMAMSPMYFTKQCLEKLCWYNCYSNEGKRCNNYFNVLWFIYNYTVNTTDSKILNGILFSYIQLERI
jgi:hypothetical protein